MEFALQDACMNNDLKKVEEIFAESPEDISKRDNDGRMGLHWAVSFQHEDIVTFLLSHMREDDIDDYTDDAGWTPFHIACAVGNLNIIQQLYNRDMKPDLDLPTLQGVTPLHLAVAKKHLEVCKFLLDNGASVRVKDKKLQLPLHRAASVGSMALVDMLCTKKSPVNARDFQGWTPLFHALAEGHGDIALLLVKQYNSDYESTEDSNGSKALDVVLNDKVKKFFLQNI